MKKNNLIGFIFLSPYIIFFIIFMLIPTLSGFLLSFTDYTGYSLDNLSFVGFENYSNIFNSHSLYFNDFWGSVLRTTGFVIFSVPFLIGIPLILASFIADLDDNIANFFRIIFYIPSLFSVAAIGLLGVWFFEQEYGLVNYINSYILSSKIPWVNDSIFAWIAILLLTIWWTIGGNLIIYLAALKNISKELYEAAELDGASKIQKFFHVTIPGVKNQIVFTTIMSVIASFNLYGQPAVLTAGGPGRSTTTITMYIREIGFGSAGTAGQAAAMSIIFGIIIMSISFLQYKLTKGEKE